MTTIDDGQWRWHEDLVKDAHDPYEWSSWKCTTILLPRKTIHNKLVWLHAYICRRAKTINMRKHSYNYEYRYLNKKEKFIYDLKGEGSE